MKRYLPLILIAICIVTNIVEAQTTEFTYQGKLTDGSIAATGDYNFEFRLFSVNTGGTVISTIQRLGVPVSSGVFTVKLDFGANFDGQPRWLEIAIKPAGDPGGFQQLLPRQPVTSAPYSIRSLNASTADTATNATNATNAAQLGGIAASQYVLTGDARLSDARDPLPGSASYIQNRPIQQASSNFNISGDGTAGGTLSGNVLFGNVVNAATQFNIGGNRVLSTAGTNNVFVGPGTGMNNNTGAGNSFLGQDAGNVNAAGSQNTFVGRWAGFSNTGADSNTFVGFGAGKSTTAGSNAFFGANAGNANTTGSSNTIIGANADVNSGNLTHATAIGAGAISVNSNEITLGRASGSDRVVIAGPLNINGQVTANDVNIISSLFLGSLAPAGSEHLCRNNNALVATCSSSLRYKTNLAPYRNGLNILNRLRPITFDWKEGGMHDLGFGAEDVEKIDPLLVTYNSQGQVEGVKYDRIGVVLVNAVKEQQAQIAAQKKMIDGQQAQIDAQQKQIEQQKRQFESLTKIVYGKYIAGPVLQFLRF